MNRPSQIGLGLVLSFVYSSAILVNLDSTPPLWWDEGWTLTVARTWVEQGHYGLLLSGKPAPPELSAAFPSVLSIAASFRLLGIGVWQGRLVGAVYMLGALLLLYLLALRLYNRRIALGTLLVVVFMSSHLEMNPLFIGRQVLAEPLMLFFLLAGYASFLSALRRPLIYLPLSILLWAIALISKSQPLPFWAASLALPLFVSLLGKNWRYAGLTLAGLIGSYALSRELLIVQGWVLSGHTLPMPALNGLLEITAIVPLKDIRAIALTIILVIGLPTLLGTVYAAGVWLRWFGAARFRLVGDRGLIKLMLICFTGSWLAWYLLLSVGWIRYLFPATFVGSVFVSAMLYDLTFQFSLPGVVAAIQSSVRQIRFDRRSVQALAVILIIAVFTSVTWGQLARLRNTDTSAVRLASLLNSSTAPDSLTETYEGELCFLLNRPYHYPPPPVSVELTRRTELGQNVSVSYDPMASEPDYLVVGRFGREGRLYDPTLASGAFALWQSIGSYEVYRRIR